MPEKTANYKLNQWKKEDDFLMRDFNADNAALETALTGLKSAVDSKAAQSEVDTLKTTVSAKANQSDLTTLTNTVNTKAAQSELNTLKNTVNSVSATANAKASIVVGSYVGDGVNGRDINLGFQPKAVFVFREDGVTCSGESGSGCYGGFFYPGHNLIRNSCLCAEVVSNGFRVHTESYAGTNNSNKVYYYLALR